MEILDRLETDMKQAMRDKDKFRLSVIRMLRSEIKNMEINSHDNISEQDVISLIDKERKKRVDSIEEYRQADREDIVNDLERELSILQEYLPKQLSQEELLEIVDQVIEDTEAKSQQDMGKVMQQVMPKVKGKADGNQVKQLVAEKLQH